MLSRLSARSLVSSDLLPARADALQYELEEGLCLTAAESDTDALLVDVAVEARWPRYAQPLESQTPIRTVLSLRLAAEASR